MRRDDVQRCDVEAEFPGFGEFAEAGAEGEEVIAGDGGGEVGEGEREVVHSGFVEAEDVLGWGGGVGGCGCY